MPKSPNALRSLCWNCIHASNPEPHTCPWASQGKRVDGWKLKKGPLDLKGNPTPLVISCPIYKQKYQYFEAHEVVQALSEHLKKSIIVITNNPIKMAQYTRQYEKETGKKLPEWFWFYIESRRLKREAILKGVPLGELEEMDEEED